MLGFRKVRVPAVSPVEVPVSPSAPAPCANCGDASPGKFCSGCGQERRKRLVSLRELLGDFLEDELLLGSRLPRTLGSLLTRPGHLTAEYARGRIVRYVRPLKLYLGASVIFFLLVSVLDSDWFQVGAEVEAPAAPAASTAAEAAPGVTVEATPASVPGAQAQERADALARRIAAKVEASTGGIVAEEGKSWVDEVQINASNPLIEQLLEKKRDHFRGMTPREAVREVMAAFREHVPTMMFVLLPVFALLLKLLYVRRGRLYVEHFVFALHLHAFAFAAFGVMLLVRNGAVSALVWTWVMLYTFLAMRRVYGQSFVKTGVKYIALGWSYFMVLTFALAVTAIVTLLLV